MFQKRRYAYLYKVKDTRNMQDTSKHGKKNQNSYPLQTSDFNNPTKDETYLDGTI